jgi:hypothetical protein
LSSCTVGSFSRRAHLMSEWVNRTVCISYLFYLGLGIRVRRCSHWMFMDNVTPVLYIWIRGLVTLVRELWLKYSLPLHPCLAMSHPCYADNIVQPETVKLCQIMHPNKGENELKDLFKIWSLKFCKKSYCLAVDRGWWETVLDRQAQWRMRDPPELVKREAPCNPVSTLQCNIIFNDLIPWAVLHVQLLVMTVDCACATLSVCYKCHFYDMFWLYKVIIRQILSLFMGLHDL